MKSFLAKGVYLIFVKKGKFIFNCIVHKALTVVLLHKKTSSAIKCNKVVFDKNERLNVENQYWELVTVWKLSKYGVYSGPYFWRFTA